MINPNSTYNYLIGFRPLDYYFFGGEITFGESQNYYAKTQALPQQTTILGVLRHLGYDRVDIGDHSFNAADPKAAQQFGYIRQLSPLFLVQRSTNTSRYYIPGAFGRSDGRPYPVNSAGNSVNYWNGSQWQQSYQLPQYIAKDGWEQYLVSAKNEEKKAFDEVIHVFSKIGITKIRSGEDRRDAFFKQDTAKLAADWEFAVLASLDQEQAQQLATHTILPMGAQKALFRISLTPVGKEQTFDDLFPNTLWAHDFPAELDGLVLLSDAWVKEDILDHCSFAVTADKDFRNIRTPRKLRQFARIYQHDQVPNGQSGGPIDRLYKSAKYNLLQRGSILYGKKEKLQPYLDQQAYQTIGYNHYTIL